MLSEIDITLRDGRTVHAYDAGGVGSGPAPKDDLVVFWHHGTPQLGAPPQPLLDAARHHGIRLVSHDRPGYAGSTRQPGRTVASVAGDVSEIADALGIDRFAVMGHSGGGPHALACAALLTERVVGAVCMSGLAPINADGLGWIDGMVPPTAAELEAAMKGPAALESFLASTEFDESVFTSADHAALAGSWSSVGVSAEQAVSRGLGGMVDDDLAYVRPWGVDIGRIRAPVLFVHGSDDRMVPPSHSRWLAGHAVAAETELWLRTGDGHVSVLDAATAALGWLADPDRPAAGSTSPG